MTVVVRSTRTSLNPKASAYQPALGLAMVPGPAALETSDFTARVMLDGLPAGQRIFYRVLFQDLSDIRSWSDTSSGSFSTPPASAAQARDVTLAWSADTVGQGWGINPEWGGLRLYETMRAAQPDVFIHSGDTIYADQPLGRELKLADLLRFNSDRRIRKDCL